MFFERSIEEIHLLVRKFDCRGMSQRDLKEIWRNLILKVYRFHDKN